MKLHLYITLLFFSATLFAQQTPAPIQSEAYTIVGANAHIGDGKIIKNALIIIQDGKIEFIGDANTRITKRGKIINAKGHDVYPGFIAPNTTLGLAEIDAVRASRDEDEIGTMNPHIRSLIAYNTESKVIETMRPNGVLIAQITPRGGRISGTSSIVQLDAWNWEDAVIRSDDGIHLNWPKSFLRTDNWWNGEPITAKINKGYNKQVEEIEVFFRDAQAHNAGNSSKTNLPFEALDGIFDGSKKLFIHVNDQKSIIDAVNFSKQYNVKDIVIVGGAEAHLVIDFLKENDVPILLKRVHSRPLNNDDDYDIMFKLAKKLTDAKLLVGLETSGDMERMQTRNLPFLAGTCAAFGMLKKDALKLITLNTAKILGIDAHYGSLTRGKSATLFISEGDALDMKTNKLTHAFIDGRLISLKTHQTALYKRYSKKYADLNTSKLNNASANDWRSRFKNTPKKTDSKKDTQEKVKPKKDWRYIFENTNRDKSKTTNKEDQKPTSKEKKKATSTKEKKESSQEKTKKKKGWRHIFKNTNREENN